MDAKTKKILLYGGGAILLGSVAFFVYSFFKKDKIVIGNTNITIDEEPKEEKSKSSDIRFLPREDFSQGIGFTPSILKGN
jgi:hypothetical protein